MIESNPLNVAMLNGRRCNWGMFTVVTNSELLTVHHQRISLGGAQWQAFSIKSSVRTTKTDPITHTITTSQMISFLCFITLALALAPPTIALYPDTSPARLQREELNKTAPTVDFLGENPPGPLEFNGTKLVNDDKHPWMPLRTGDIRGPCPGLNTLASHGVDLQTFGLTEVANQSL